MNQAQKQASVVLVWRREQLRCMPCLWWNYHEMLVTGACCMPHTYLHGVWFCLWILNLLLLCLVSPWSCHSAPTSSSKPNYLPFNPDQPLLWSRSGGHHMNGGKWWPCQPFQTLLRVLPSLAVPAWEKLPPSPSRWPGHCSFSLSCCVGAQFGRM